MTEHSPNPFNEDSDEANQEGNEDKNIKPRVSFLELFRYANKMDILYMLLGIITCAIQANLNPVFFINLGNIIMKMKDRKDVIKRSCDVNDTVADEILLDYVWSDCGYFLIMAAAAFCAGVINVFMFKISAENQIFSMRQKLLWSIFRQDIEWFNEHTPGKLTSYQSEFMTTITRGIGTNLLNLGQGIFGFIGGFVLAFAYSWRLTLMLLCLFPIISLTSFCVAKIIKDVTAQEILAYEEASRMSEEAISSVKTVVAFGGENRECERYDNLLSVSRKIAIKKNIAIGALNGLLYFMIFGYYGLGMWFCDVLVRHHDDKLSHLITALICVLNSSYVLGEIVPSLGNIVAARITAHKLYEVIDEEPSIDNFSTTGVQPNKITGEICFQNVSFKYPSRPDVQILHSISFAAEPGNTIALVGASGCGKSTVLQLLQRLYDVSSGKILVGGRNIRDYNIGYFRKLFGVVSQEPVLFSTSIAENIRHGNEDATEEDIITAAKEANAHGFISLLPQKYNTLVGESGGKLSGGQKQRIAIARAMVRNPRFLLLDEATSALDAQSEKIVQSALDKIKSSRTTIVAAHRLSTIQFADMVLCFDKGEIVERGTHEELMKEEGLYHSMVLAQKLQTEGAEQNKEKTKQVQLETAKCQSGEESTENEAPEEEEKDLPKGNSFAVMKLNLPEWREITIGVIISMSLGVIQPFYGVLISETIAKIGVDKSEVRKYCLFFVLIGVMSLVCNVLQYGIFGMSGENLCMKIRSKLFKSFLHQEMAWFDEKKNTSGYLCAVLARDASLIKEAGGIKAGFLLQIIGVLFSGVVICFVYGWILTFVICCLIPIILYGMALEIKMLSNAQTENSAKVEAALSVITEALQNIKTVLTVSLGKTIYQKNANLIKSSIKAYRRSIYKAAIMSGICQSLIYILYFCIFYIGCVLVSKCHMEYQNVIKIFFTLMPVCFISSSLVAQLKDTESVSQATSRVISLIDRLSSLDKRVEGGVKPVSFKNNIQFREIEFHYPSRQNIKILKGFNLDINRGETVALIGRSGCGKSTCMQLIEKFYYPDKGNLYLDGKDLSDINTSWLRQQIALVSQEPVLFSRSIEENIAYGDLSRSVTIDEIVNAAQQANIHSFINSLPEGYATKAGQKGSQLSGGQKQRIAIARALIRNPKILLLDEATSALDTESEQIVQDALDKARVGRTCIVIAHRLSTIRNSDRIAVIDEGKVHEIGSHTELVEKEGIYSELLNNQNL